MLEEEYTLDYFAAQGLVRKICPACGSAFWTRDHSRERCGDAPCEPYSFIGNPVFRPHTLKEMREAFLSFFEEHGHTRLERYPVAARWREDVYLTIASIADFQPFVTSGMAPPPANPLTISQPCIRLNDLDSVGRSGRHLTLFEMMAHHAFNTDSDEIYWKDRTVEFCDQFLASIGADLEKVTYKEHPWIGGGNAGPSLEVIIGGLEVATLVFMNLTRRPENGGTPVELDGDLYYPMSTRVVDTGYGLERFVWASNGAPTIYDAVFPEMVCRLMTRAGLEHLLEDGEFAQILGQNARFAGLMDITSANIHILRQRVSESIGVPLERLEELIVPIEKIYTIADHTRCLSYMLGDCIVPSNVQEGYLARLVLRRTLRMMQDLKLDEDLGDLIEYQMKTIGLDTFDQDLAVVREIVDHEVTRYRATLERGTRIVRRTARKYAQSGDAIPTEDLIMLYDSHGLPPEMVREVAADEGVDVDFPAHFYSLIADRHSGAEAEEEPSPFSEYQGRIADLPPTKPLYYEQPCDTEFEGMVLDYFDGYVVLDQTLFYPHGGGQPSDTGTLVTEESMLRVDDVVRFGDVILHHISGGVIKRGETVKGMLDEDRRWSLMRHHTATHILLEATRSVLGAHVHQAGAQKGSESSRLDIRHFRHISPAELRRIEIEANRLVMEDSPVYIRWEVRTRAEQKYGFCLYQGGVPPGSDLRIVQVGGDVQACAGTHCRNTGEVGAIKLIRVEHIQDGIERLEFAAGLAAINHMEYIEGLLSDSADALSVQPEHLPATVRRFFSEWKERGKEIERLQARVIELEKSTLTGEEIGGVRVIVRRIDAPPRELAPLARGIAEDGGVALLAAENSPVAIVAASGNPEIDAAALVREVCDVMGGKGGGKPGFAQGAGQDSSKLGDALAHGREMIARSLHG